MTECEKKGNKSKYFKVPSLFQAGTLLNSLWARILGRLLLLLLQVASVVSDSVRPHRRQPTRLPHPWDSPGKNTGVGGHFLLQCMIVKSESEVAQSCLTLSDPMDCSHQAPPSMGFSRQEYWSGVPLPSPILGLLSTNQD